MYDVKQFKPALYVVLTLGLSGFALSAELPALGALSAIAIALNAWLVHSGRFMPLPRWVASSVTMIALMYVVSRMVRGDAPPLMYIGQFLAFLQLIKLFEQRSNRDYAQLLVLSLLLMVAAAINTSSLLFGVLMSVYLIVSLYCCLLYHLKSETDRARAALAIPVDRFNPATLRHDQRYLPRSMRRLTALIASVALTSAVLVFLFFPRGPGQGMLGQLRYRTPTFTGFSDEIGFEQITRIKQNNETVAHLTLQRNGELVRGTESLYLRGFTADAYGIEPSRTGRPQWISSTSRNEPGRGRYRTADGNSAERWKQTFRLQPNGSRYLFALPGVVLERGENGHRVPAITLGRTAGLQFNPADQSISTDAIMSPLEYEVVSHNAPQPPPAFGTLLSGMYLPPSDPVVLDQVRRYVLELEDIGPLVAGRSGWPAIQPSNEVIARRIERYLRSNFDYTLDLTDSRRQFRDTDPVMAFLTDVRKGHCEYFASAMTLMCQSIGIPARLVAGFRTDGDSYNVIGQYYIVTQAQAHAWVEVLTPDGWMTFDPTSSNQAGSSASASLWTSLGYFFDFLEYKWAEAIVTYDQQDRENMIESIGHVIGDMLAKVNRAVAGAAQLTERFEFWNTSQRILTGVFLLLIAAVLFAIGVFVVQHRRLRLRAVRIGLEALPAEQQVRLARQLAFYDQLIGVLDHHQIVRPPHLTHQEFCESLVYLPNDAFRKIRRLTTLFYQVRFGQARLSPSQQHRLQRVVMDVADALRHAEHRA